MTITVTRVTRRPTTTKTVLKYDTIEKQDADAAVGSRKVTTEGVTGLQQVTYVETYVERQAHQPKVAKVTVLKQPVDEVVVVGPEPPPAQPAGCEDFPTTGGLNWCGLARCESGLNPNAYNPAGPYYGLYQFDQGTWQSNGGTGTAERAVDRRADPGGLQPLPGPRASTLARAAAATSDRVGYRRGGDRGRCWDRRRCARWPPSSASRRPRRSGRTSCTTRTRSAGSCGPPQLRPDDVVLEVGPGLGSLTLGLLDAAAARTAVEVDPVLAGGAAADRRRPARRTGPAGSTVLAADALRLDARAGPAADRAGREPAVQRRGAGACCTCWSCCPRCGTGW